MTYSTLAKKMKKLGAVNAISLDGGPSTAFIFADNPEINLPASSANKKLNTIIYVE